MIKRVVYNSNMYVEVIGGYSGILSVSAIEIGDHGTTIFYSKRVDIAAMDFNANDSTLTMRPVSQALKHEGVGEFHIPKDALFHIFPSSVEI